ncbi:MAG: transposase, partial [Thiohalomonadales bacterium]
HRNVYHTITQLVIGSIRRSIILYEEVHTLKTKEKPKTHRIFLERLYGMIPAECIPILVTDAGFRTPWFREVESLGWDWVGRVRNRHMVKRYNSRNKDEWKDCKTYYSQASSTPKHLG